MSAAAQARAIWVNVADEPEHCTLIVPAQVRRGELTLAISTGGAGPALAGQLRQELQQHFGPEYGPYLDLLRRVRTRCLTERRAHPDNGPLFHRLVNSPLREAVAQGDRTRVVQRASRGVGVDLKHHGPGRTGVPGLEGDGGVRRGGLAPAAGHGLCPLNRWHRRLACACGRYGSFYTNGHFLVDTMKDEKWLVLVGRPSLAASRWRARRPAPPSYFHINDL